MKDLALVRWNPWREVNTLQRQFDRLFDETLVPAIVLERGLIRVPAAELKDTEDAVHLKLEVPGMEAKDLDVQVTENAVYISAEIVEYISLISSVAGAFAAIAFGQVIYATAPRR